MEKAVRLSEREMAVWRMMTAAESADLSELESAAYRLDDASAAFTSFIETYPGSRLPGSIVRMKNLTDGYRAGFAGFSLALIRDTACDEAFRRQAIATVLVSEEQKRISAISRACGRNDLEFARSDPGELIETMNMLYDDTTLNEITVSAMGSQFNFMLARDMRVLRKYFVQ